MIFNSQRLTACCALIACLLYSGCRNDSSSADAVVQGTVTIDGVLAPRGQVTFHPVKQGPVATGPIHSDGSFSLRIGQGNMANPDESKIYSGEYVATVVVNEPADASARVGEGGPPLAGKRLSSIKYSQKDTSGLTFTVKPGRNVFPIELEGSQNDPPPEETQQTDEGAAGNEQPVEETQQDSDDGAETEPESKLDAMPSVEKDEQGAPVEEDAKQ